MPQRTPRTCLQNGCAEPAIIGGNRCDAHKKETWAQRNARPEIKDSKKFYDSSPWRSLRQMVLMREPWCRACKKALAVVVDHIQRIRGGGNHIDERNLQPLCKICDAKKRSEESRL